MTDWTHDQLQRDLADHLARPDRMVWQDMQLGPSGSPRPDVYTMQKSYTNPDPRAFEIKVSASDFRSDVTSGKAMGYLQFAGSVTFCMPADLAKQVRNDLPKGAGLMVRGPTGWRAAKRATRHPVEIPRKALLKLLIDGVERQHRAYRAKQFSVHQATKQLGEELGKLVARAMTQPTQLEAELEQLRISHKDALAKRRQQQESAKNEIDAEIQRISEALGLQGSSHWAVINKLRDMVTETNVDRRVADSQQRLAEAAREIGLVAARLERVVRRDAA